MFVVCKCLKWACKPVTNKNVDILGMMNDGGKSSTLDKWGKISTRIINYLQVYEQSGSIYLFVLLRQLRDGEFATGTRRWPLIKEPWWKRPYIIPLWGHELLQSCCCTWAQVCIPQSEHMLKTSTGRPTVNICTRSTEIMHLSALCYTWLELELVLWG